MPIRRYTFKLYPTPSQAKVMEERRRLHCQLYNAALQQRIEAYRRQEKTLGLYDQQAEIAALRAECEEFAPIAVTELRGTLKRLDDAMKAFFRRAKSGAGASSGFPRFRRSDDYPGWGYYDKSGWSVAFRDNGTRHGRLYMKGIGRVKMRGLLPMVATQKSADVIFRDGIWKLSLVVEIATRRERGNAAGHVHFDLIESFASVRMSNGGCPAGPNAIVSTAADGRITLRFQQDAQHQVESPRESAVTTTPATLAKLASTVESPRDSAVTTTDSMMVLPAPVVESPRESAVTTTDHRCRCSIAWVESPRESAVTTTQAGLSLRAVAVESPCESAVTKPLQFGLSQQQRIAQLQQQRARCKRGSCKSRLLKLQIARLSAKAAAIRANTLHNWSAALVKQFGDLSVVAPGRISELTESGKGTAHNPGAAVKTVASVNKLILAQAPATVIQMLSYKQEEAGGNINIVNDDKPHASVGKTLSKAKKTVRSMTSNARKISA